MFINQIGAVALFATLFVASLVKAEVGCVFDFEHDNLSADFELECNDVKNLWRLSDVKSKKTLSLDSEQNGCLRTRHTIPLNSTTKVNFRFLYDGLKEYNGKITIKLKPAEGSCPGEECTWEVDKDPKFKNGEWIEVDHLFPINATKQYFIQLQVGKSKGKFFVDHISVPDARNEAGKCHTGAQMKIFDYYKGLKLVNIQKVDDAATTAATEAASEGAATEAASEGGSGAASEGEGGGSGSTEGGGGGGGDSGGDSGGDDSNDSSTPSNEDSTNSSAVTYTLLSKNLMFTTASVLTLNNLLN